MMAMRRCGEKERVWRIEWRSKPNSIPNEGCSYPLSFSPTLPRKAESYGMLGRPSAHITCLGCSTKRSWELHTRGNVCACRITRAPICAPCRQKICWWASAWLPPRCDTVLSAPQPASQPGQPRNQIRGVRAVCYGLEGRFAAFFLPISISF
jgi:hypothetical protein